MTDRSDRPPLEPVTLIHRRDHEFDGPLTVGGVKVQRARCAHCGKAPSNIMHHGYAPSMNVGGSGWNPHVFQGAKKAWMRLWAGYLEETALPRGRWVPDPSVKTGRRKGERFEGLGSVRVEAQICFPTLGPRDQGNFDYLLHKSFADMLQEEGYIGDDRFYPEQMYVFGGLEARYTPGEASTIVTIFPAWPEEETAVAGQQALGV